MKILFVTQRVPFPPDRGDKIATYNIIKHLRQKNEVVVCCLADGNEDLVCAEEFEKTGIEIYAIKTNALRAIMQAGWALLSTRALSVAYLNEPRLHKAVAQVLTKGDIDAALVYSSNVAQFVEGYEQLPKVIHFSDLDSQKFAQYADAKPWPLNWLYQLEANRLLKYERKIANSFSHSLVCTEKERGDFEELIPGPPVTCIANGVDLSYFTIGKIKRRPHHLVFTGVMNYFPNVEGIIWFCEEILPKISEKFPDVSLTICGSSPDTQVQKLASIKNVEVTGRVPDVRDYLYSASIAIVPLRLARGIQNKVLEAMATGLPTVVTTTAANGLQAKKNRDLLIADDRESFAAAVCALLDDPVLRDTIGRNARSFIERHYSWPDQIGKLEDIIHRVVEKLPRAGQS